PARAPALDGPLSSPAPAARGRRRRRRRSAPAGLAAPPLRALGCGVWTFLGRLLDRKSTRLNSSHLVISYAVFCLKKKTRTALHPCTRGVCPAGGPADAQQWARAS